VLQGDVSLVASVLKLANSAFYGLRRQVGSLKHALLLLGKGEVQSLVLSQVLFQAFKVPNEEQKQLMVGVWKHSLECALAAEIIAEHCGEDDPAYFLGGMRHDIDKLIVVQKYLKEIEDLANYQQLAGGNCLALEMESLGCGHNELGGQILHRWMFPKQLVEMVREHHDYQRIAECDRPSQILILANLLCQFSELKEADDASRESNIVALLLSCGADSTIIPNEKSLSVIESAFRRRLEERVALLEMLQM
jgi:putative nucleotidyltransferase with HDIG domain